MTKKITIPTRAKRSPKMDQWVEKRDQVGKPDKSVKPKRLTIDLDPELHRRLKIDSVQKDIQIADRIRELIRADLGPSK
jgi:hypothetical protein